MFGLVKFLEAKCYCSENLNKFFLLFALCRGFLGCLVIKMGDLDENVIRVLVLGTINFVVNHMILDYQEIQYSEGKFSKNPHDFNEKEIKVREGYLQYNCVVFSLKKFNDRSLSLYSRESLDEKKDLYDLISENEFFSLLNSKATENNSEGRFADSETEQQRHILWLKENEDKLKALWKYGYRLYYVADVEKEVYKEIAEFIESGILL